MPPFGMGQKKMEKLKVYTDTTVVIKGLYTREGFELRKLSQNGKIQIYWSNLVLTESTQKSTELYVNGGSEDLISDWTGLQKGEILFWYEAKPIILDSTFNNEMSGYTNKTMDLNARKQVLLAGCTSCYGIKTSDAKHLITAHFANVDVLLTDDSTFYKRSQKVSWLKLDVRLASEFVYDK